MTFKLVWIVAGVLGLGIATVVSIGWYASEQVIHPPHDPPLDPSEFGLLLESVGFLSSDGLRLAGWFLRGTNGATVILAHGRGSDHTHMLPHAKYLYEAGFSVLLFDFRHRGKSEGSAQTLGAKEKWDVEGAMDYLATRTDVDQEQIGVQGNSMGAVAAILAAAESPQIRAVVAEIPFPSIRGILDHTFEKETGLPAYPFAPVTKLICEFRVGADFDEVAPVSVVGRISPRPIFLIDDLEDDLFPPNSVESVYQAAREPKNIWRIPTCPHGQGHQCAPAEYEQRVVAFWRKSFRISER